MIIMWSGAVVDIPDGWQLCDGSNGTPNLANRFIVGQSVLHPLNTTGGQYEHNHTWMDFGHLHTIPIGGDIAFGTDKSAATNYAYPTGITSETENEAPWYALCFIMKMFDDPDIREYLNWPYAAKAIIQHAHAANILQIWITFRFKMNTDNKPANNLWIVEADEVEEAIDSSEWVDQWTLLLTIDPLIGAPDKVTVGYDGPDENLATIWNKQWEHWGAILSFDISN